MPVRYLLFDAANTLIHKPVLWDRFQGALRAAGHEVPLAELKAKHKLLSECLFFPDRTSQEFYARFNGEVLYALGIIPTPELLASIFEACTYLPWEPFADTAGLRDLPLPRGVVSNFKNTLEELLTGLLGPGIFSHYVVSEIHGFAKPEKRFYEAALATIGVPAAEVLYVGDSLKLDVEPARALGMRAVLIDRENLFPHYPDRLTTLADLPTLL